MPEKEDMKKIEDNLKFRHYKEVLEIVKSLNIDVIDLNKNLLKKKVNHYLYSLRVALFK